MTVGTYNLVPVLFAIHSSQDYRGQQDGRGCAAMTFSMSVGFRHKLSVVIEDEWRLSRVLTNAKVGGAGK